MSLVSRWGRGGIELLPLKLSSEEVAMETRLPAWCHPCIFFSFGWVGVNGKGGGAAEIKVACPQFCCKWRVKWRGCRGKAFH